MELIRPFADLSRSDAALAGGKGASLGEMTRSGVPVPPGFVVLSTTFDRFLAETDLTQEIEATLAKVNHQEIHTVEHASETIQSLIKNASMPRDIADDIVRYFTELDAEFVAVRSSATAEDGAENAWAGQLDSFLNTTQESLLENVQRCWASLFTPRAIFYRFEKQLDTPQISVAVVVQKMIQSDVSGIAFSVHPVTEDRNQLIIEAGYGLGEAIVSGSITPDSYVVEKVPRKIIDKNIAMQERGIYRIPSSPARGEVVEDRRGGSEWRPIEYSRQELQKLTDEQILELSERVVTIEDHYGFPCDIEWAFEGGAFYIVQSRPITTLSISIVPETRPFELLIEDSSVTPFVIHRLSDVMAVSLKEFLDDSPRCLFQFIGRNVDWYAEILKWERAGEKIVRDLCDDPDSYAGFTESLETDIERLLILSTALYQEDFREYSIAQFEKAYTETLDLYEKVYARGMVPTIADLHKPYLTDGLTGLLKKYTGDPRGAFVRLTTPERMSTLAEEEYDLLKLAVDRSVGKNSPKIQRHRHHYFWLTFGYEGPVYSLADIWVKIEAWRSRPDDLVARVTELEDRRSSGAVRIETTVRELGIPEKIQKTFSIARNWLFLKEARKAAFFATYAAMDRLAEAMAERRGVSKDSIKFLTSTEVKTMLHDSVFPDDIEARFENRVLGYEDGREIVLSGEPARAYLTVQVNHAVVTATEMLSGQVAYVGKVEGRVRLIRTPEDMAKMGDGDILVSPATNPNLLPAMQRAAAFITDVGGITCHASIVAREMRKPCIIGTKFATQVLHDGDLVEVDADAGVVRIVERASEMVQATPHFRKEDYILSFWVRGVSILVTDLHRDVYGALETLFIIDRGMFKQYFTRRAYGRAKEEGVLFYSDPQAFDRYREELLAQCERMNDFYISDIRDAAGVTKESVSTIFEYAKKLCGDYVQMNFERTDKAFLIQEENPIVKENLSGVAAFKDTIRAIMNTVLFESDGHLARLLTLLSKQFDIPVESLDDLTQSEIFSLFEGMRPDTSITSRRQEAFVESCGMDGYLEGTIAETVIREFREEGDATDTFSGQTANGGRVTGTVKIIPVDYGDLARVHVEMERMHEGDILVAETTAPELIIACRKAGAIVTDMGGLMSHAAIVSRELGIPCVIGTKIATQVLHDGDLIEVDADHGMVRIVEQVSEKGQTV